MPIPRITLTAVLLAAASCAFAQGNYNEHPLGEHTFQEYDIPYRADEISISVPAFGDLEYKLSMREGDVAVYTWDAGDLAKPEFLTSEFHGHNTPTPERPGDLMFYRKAQGAEESGMLVAPFDGDHGWYFLNGSDQEIVVTLKVSGFYELIPGQLAE